MIVDFHTHIFCEGICNNRDKYLDDRQFNFLYDTKSKVIDHGNLLESMKNSGIDFAVAMGFPWENEEYCEEQNEYFSRVVELSEGKIIPFGSVPLNTKVDIDKWVKDIKDKGLYGIGEVSFYLDGMNTNNEQYLRGLLEAVRRYSLPLCLHVNEPLGHIYKGKYDPNFSRLYSVVKDYPDVNIIFAHWGGGLLFYELMPEVSKAFKNFYYDTAASPFLYNDKIYDISVRITGSKKILFGSDYPLIKFNRYIASVDENIHDKEAKANILGRNALDLLKIK